MRGRGRGEREQNRVKYDSSFIPWPHKREEKDTMVPLKLAYNDDMRKVYVDSIITILPSSPSRTFFLPTYMTLTYHAIYIFFISQISYHVNTVIPSNINQTYSNTRTSSSIQAT